MENCRKELEEKGTMDCRRPGESNEATGIAI
jgi:hypothetical protein